MAREKEPGAHAYNSKGRAISKDTRDPDDEKIDEPGDTVDE